MISQEDREVGQSFMWFWILGIIAVVIAVIVFTSMRPAIQHYETQTTRQSEQYRSSAETRLLDKLQSWRDLDSKINLYKNDPDIVKGFRANQKALVRQMRTEAGRLQPNQVPQDVREFLDEHKDE